MDYINIFFDIVMIGLLIAGIRYALKLSQQLSDLRQGRMEMERFIGQFNATVSRAESGILGLKTAARSCGDDLEGLIEKGQLLRDELTFLTESADIIANRISSCATQVAKPAESAAPPPRPQQPAQAPAPKSTKPLVQEMRNALSAANKTPSTAEQELLRALEKLG